MNAVIINAPLNKKTIFPAEILPWVHFESGTFAPLVLFVILWILARTYGYGLRWTVNQFVYYYLALGTFCWAFLGWSVPCKCFIVIWGRR